MKLEYVELAGFRGVRDRLRLDFPTGFTVITGRNGVGKSTIFDAIDFALTGNINKFAVKEAKGGGLGQHIWWVGAAPPERQYVAVGFVDEDGGRMELRREREQSFRSIPTSLHAALIRTAASASIDVLMQTTLIRDEFISALSLDLPEQARFTAVRTALGALAGPDHTSRTGAILAHATSLMEGEKAAVESARGDLGRALTSLTEARTAATRSSDVASALAVIESFPGISPSAPDRDAQVRKWIVDRRQSLRRAENARLKAIPLFGELQRLASPEASQDLLAAEENVRVARERAEAAQQDEVAAEQIEASERLSDKRAAHLASIVEHGEALGLDAGHCPLCGVLRSDEEFQTALLNTRARLQSGRHQTQVAKTTASAAGRASAITRGLRVEAEARLEELRKHARRVADDREAVKAAYEPLGLRLSVDDPEGALRLLLTEDERLVQLERALLILETSSAADRVSSLDAQVTALRTEAELAAIRLSDAETVVEKARQIDASAKTVANEILSEQFDIVMPLLKELYRRLRPHPDWTEINIDFGGRVRASLNFQVAEGRNPQFLFSSGQRRATGLAFLLAVHLSRPWCLWRSLLLDDPVQHIDDYRALNLAEVLGAVRRSGRQVVVAVEDSALADLLCRKLRGATGEPGRRFELRINSTGAVERSAVDDVAPLPRRVLDPARAS